MLVMVFYKIAWNILSARLKPAIKEGELDPENHNRFMLFHGCFDSILTVIKKRRDQSLEIWLPLTSIYDLSNIQMPGALYMPVADIFKYLDGFLARDCSDDSRDVDSGIESATGEYVKDIRTESMNT
eukprot:jgi/Tetstr1/444823/TSEL_032665.t1